jgi:hypothetical protein
MSVTDDFRAIVGRLRSWGFDIVEHPGCYGRSNGTNWTHGRPDGHTNHHYVCSMSPEQSYIDGLVANLANGSTVNWFADVNGRGYLIGTGPMNHAGTGNSSVLNRTLADEPNYGVAGSAGDMSGNQAYSGTECQHPGDSTPWPASMLGIMVAINAAEFAQWGYTANRAINHYAWTNRKIDMSWLGGVDSDANGRQLVADVQARMTGGATGGTGTDDNDWFDMATKEDLEAVVAEQLMWALPRMLNVLYDGKSNAAFPAGSTIALDGYGMIGRLQRGVSASRTGKPNSAFPDPGTPKD